jgi:hypothetical protein
MEDRDHSPEHLDLTLNEHDTILECLPMASDLLDKIPGSEHARFTSHRTRRILYAPKHNPTQLCGRTKPANVCQHVAYSSLSHTKSVPHASIGSDGI